MNQQQQNIINITEGKHIVLAPPGTGKTEILTRRLINALENGVDEDKIVNLTFTNRAAREMNNRVKEKGIDTKAFIGNIHSFSLNYLKGIGVVNNATFLLDETEQNTLVSEAFHKAELNYILSYIDNLEGTILEMLVKEYKSKSYEKFTAFYKYKYIFEVELNDLEHSSQFKKLIEDISKDINFLLEKILKNEFITNSINYLSPSKIDNNLRYFKYKNLYNYDNKNYKDPIPLKEQFEILPESFYLSIYEYYQEELNTLEALDFDDLLGLAYSYLKSNNENEKYNWLQIDEVQDLNPLQWEIINNIITEETTVVLFGDYEQSIYSFLGADISFLKSIIENYTVHNFNINYRSPSYLLEIYKEFSKIFFKDEWSVPTRANETILPEKDALIYRNFDDFDKKEEEYIIDKILPYYLDKGTTAILVRFNNKVNDFSYMLERKGISHFKVSTSDIFKSSLLKSTLPFLSSLINPYSRTNWFYNMQHFLKFTNAKTATQFTINLFNSGFIPSDFFFDNESILINFQHYIQNERIVVFDTETTGLDTNNDDIIQIAGIELINGKIGQTFEVFLKTDKDLTESQKIHKITREYLDEHAIDRKIALEKFLDFVGESSLVAHNLKYDKSIIESNLKRENIQNSLNTIQFDTLDIAKRLFPRLHKYKLEYLIEYLNIEGINSHNALDDVIATANLIIGLDTHLEAKIFDQKKFLLENEKAITKLKGIFKETYCKHSNFLKRNVDFSKYFDFLSQELSIQLNFNKPSNYDKLLRYFDLKIKEDTLENTLLEWLDILNTFKETDLIIGDENLIISTIHRSKGLQFDNVFIPSCNNGIYPFIYADEEEDARLFYVALTRAKKRLILSSHTKNNKTSFEFKDNVKVFLPYTKVESSKFISPIKNYFNSRDIKTST